jgi:hypothetical protein
MAAPFVEEFLSLHFGFLSSPPTSQRRGIRDGMGALPARQQTKRREILVDRSELLGLTAQARHGEREIPEKVIGIPDDGFTRAESSTTSPLAAASTRTADDSNRALRSVASHIQ